MEITTTQSSLPLDVFVQSRPREVFPPLEQVTTPTVPTPNAAYYLNRKDQTLRTWACYENGPIRPVKINGRLAWPVPRIRQLLAGGQ